MSCFGLKIADFDDRSLSFEQEKTALPLERFPFQLVIKNNQPKIN